MSLSHGIEVTESARAYLSVLLRKQGQNTACRLFVERGGTPMAETFLAYHEPFEFKREDPVLSVGEFDLHLDASSLPFLEGTIVNYDTAKDRLTLFSPKAKSKSESLSEENRFTAKEDLKATRIPSGLEGSIPKGAEVFLIRRNPTSVAVSHEGGWWRLEEEAARSGLGIEFEDFRPPEGPLDEAYLLEVLRACYDPEIPVNVVDLGLIYRCEVRKLEEGYAVEVVMTLTAPGCAMGEAIVSDVKATLSKVADVSSVSVSLSFDPPWDQTRLSDSAKLELGMI